MACFSEPPQRTRHQSSRRRDLNRACSTPNLESDLKSELRTHFKQRVNSVLGDCTIARAARHLLQALLRTLCVLHVLPSEQQMHSILKGAWRLKSKDHATLLVVSNGCFFAPGGFIVPCGDGRRMREFYTLKRRVCSLEAKIRTIEAYQRENRLPTELCPDWSDHSATRPFDHTKSRDQDCDLRMTRKSLQARLSLAVHLVTRVQVARTQLGRLRQDLGRATARLLTASQLNGTHGEATNEDDLPDFTANYAAQLIASFVVFAPGIDYTVIVESDESIHVATVRSPYVYLPPNMALFALFSCRQFYAARYVRVCRWVAPMQDSQDPEFVHIFTNPRFSQLASSNGEITEGDDFEFIWFLTDMFRFLLLTEVIVWCARLDKWAWRDTVKRASMNYHLANIFEEFDREYAAVEVTGGLPAVAPCHTARIQLWVFQLALAACFDFTKDWVTITSMASIMLIQAVRVLESYACRVLQPSFSEGGRTAGCGQIHLVICYESYMDEFEIDVPVTEVSTLDEFENYTVLCGHTVPQNTLALIAAYTKVIERFKLQRTIRIALNGVNGEATNLDDMQRGGRGRGAGRGRGRGLVPQNANVAVNQLVQAVGQIVAGGNPPNAPPAPVPPAPPPANPPGHAAQVAYNNLPPTLVGPTPAYVMSFASFDPMGKNIVPFNVLPADARTYLQNAVVPPPLIRENMPDLAQFRKLTWPAVLLHALAFIYPELTILAFAITVIAVICATVYGRNTSVPFRVRGGYYMAMPVLSLSFLPWVVTSFLLFIAFRLFHLELLDDSDNCGDIHNRPIAFCKAYDQGAYLFRMILAPTPIGPLGNDVRPASHRNSALKYDHSIMSASIHCVRHDDKARFETTIANVQFDMRWAASNYRYQASGIEDTIAASLRAAAFDNTGNTETCRDPQILAWFYRFVASQSAQYRSKPALNLLGVGFDPSTCVDTESGILMSS